MGFDRLAGDDPAALDLLTVMAWCGPEPVPFNLLTDHPDQLPERLATAVGDPLALARCTGLLNRRGMAVVTPHSIGVHRGPAALLRARSGDDGWPAIVFRLLHAALPGHVWNNPPVWPRWQQLLPHVLAATEPDRSLDNVIDEVSSLLNRLAAVGRTGHVSLGQQPVMAAEILAGRRVTIRIEPATLMFFDPDTRELLRVRPNPLTG